MKILLENHKFARYFLPHPLNVHRKCVIRAYLGELGRLDTLHGSKVPLGAEIGPSRGPPTRLSIEIYEKMSENPEIS